MEPLEPPLDPPLFTHCLIRLMCGTRDHPDESPQSIVNNSYTCTVTHAVTLAKLVS